jgi:hypothetical protein
MQDEGNENYRQCKTSVIKLEREASCKGADLSSRELNIIGK